MSSVEDKFVFVMRLTAELLEACTNAKGQYEEDLQTAQIGLKIAQEHEKTAKEEKENASKQFDEMQKELKQNQQQMKDARKWLIAY